MTVDDFEFSVIIPTYNRGVILEKCLGALAHQILDADSYEIIVSDDGSEDDTKGRTEGFAKKVSNHIRYLWQPNRGANAARNHAIQESKGRILLFINDDTISTPTMLLEHQRTHQHYPAENVTVLGRVTYSPELQSTLFSKLHLDASYALWEGQTELDWRAFYTCNVSIKKSFLMKYGLFEEKMRYHEDLELSLRLSHHGLKVIYNPKALGYHHHYLEEEAYLNVAKQDGKALVVWYKKTPHLKKELASIGFYLTSPLPKRIKYLIGNLLTNRLTIPFLLASARFFSKRQERIALIIYRKIFQSLKREAIRNELIKKT